ncbi:MAG: type IX secretion system sortase PorU [Saprospiraceae bacterium]|nr:type IX secretion system sortase PorU [Saprospiraceae bacterium]MBP7679582.1 type IX secretion system sortase PorU [Saprospiraceae bacterium]
MFKKAFTLSILILFVSFTTSLAQQAIVIQQTIKWVTQPLQETSFGGNSISAWGFEGAIYEQAAPTLPVFLERFQLRENAELTARIINVEYEPVSMSNMKHLETIGEELQLRTVVEQDRNKFFGKLLFMPFRKSGNGYERVKNFEIAITTTPKPTTAYRNPNNTYNSILKDSDVYRIAVKSTGAIKLDYNFLKNLGIAVDNIDPRTIHLYSNGGGMLPEPTATTRYDDIVENAITVTGEDDGVFNTGDAVLFYAEGADKTYFNPTTLQYNRPNNLYTDHQYFYLKIGNGNGKRINTNNSVSNTAYTVTSFENYQRYERDVFNLLDYSTSAQGSGKRWFGDQFKLTRDYDFTNKFAFANLIIAEPIYFRMAFAGRSGVPSVVRAIVGGQTFSVNISATVLTDVEADFAKMGNINQSITLTNNSLDVVVRYPEVAGDPQSEGWLDFIDITARCSLALTNSSLLFSDSKTLNYNTVTYQLDNASSDITIWDVTNTTEPAAQQTLLNGTKAQFGVVNNNTFRRYLAFTTEGIGAPESGTKISNQNIHEIDNVDLVIVYHKNFEAEVERLAQHRRTYNAYSVVTVDVDKIYQEFSCGVVDPTAIRDFAKMLFDRNNRFKYLLLVGDGSFDYRNIANNSANSNFIPVVETGVQFEPQNDTHGSINPIEAFPTDDYYGLLSNDEGDTNFGGALDIAVGRLPVNSAAEATAMINKIIAYDTDVKSLGSWRLTTLFNADDADNNGHLRDIDNIAINVDTTYRVFNQDKIYYDAFPRVSTPAGARFPAANAAQNSAIYKGALVVNYMGHGGPRGWAQERVLSTTDIAEWTNQYKLPLFITATCSFAGYDAPDIVTAGEQIALKESGGGVALYTTVRPVYIFANENLTRAVFNRLYKKEEGKYLAIGEILRIAKNAVNSGSNGRRFTLLGDPSMYLAIPEYQIITSTINGNAINSISADTLRALQTVTITGYVADANGNVLSNYNGKVYPTIYDKPVTLYTLGQAPGSTVRPFKVQKNVIFKGTAAVSNGQFTFTFVVPKDINYQYGNGKISYYAENGTPQDAAGFYEGIIIGGTDPNAPADDTPPVVQVFMNNENFVIGGITNDSPVLLAKLSDDNGINVVGNSIGHDLTSVLDNQTQDTYILNDFYTAELDNYKKGEVRYPLSKLAVGKHRISIKAWDIANNSAEGHTEFIVTDNAEAALDHVLNYPNPFTTNTEFMFEHNLVDQLLDVKIDIYTISGKLVKTIEQQVMPQGFRVSGIKWNGRDDFDGQLAKGVYLYKIRLATTDTVSNSQKAESKFEKLVILK